MNRERRAIKDKRVEEKERRTFLLTFISSTLESLVGNDKIDVESPDGFFNTVFINPDIYVFLSHSYLQIKIGLLWKVSSYSSPPNHC